MHRFGAQHTEQYRVNYHSKTAYCTCVARRDTDPNGQIGFDAGSMTRRSMPRRPKIDYSINMGAFTRQDAPKWCKLNPPDGQNSDWCIDQLRFAAGFDMA